MIAIRPDETMAQFKARVAQIQANRCSFFDSEEENGSAAETGTVIEYEHERIGDRFYASGMDYEEGLDTRSIYEKLADFGKSAAARASDPEGQKAYIQGQLDKIIGIGEGLNIAKESTKAAVVAGWTAMTDGTVANFLAKPNAINDPLFHAVGDVLDAMEKDPNAVNHALERVGTFVMNASESYTAAPNKEKGHVIGETMFGMVNPEGSTKAGETAVNVVDSVATHVDDAVAKVVMNGYRSAEDQIQAFPKQAESIRKLLHDRLQQFDLTPQQLEYVGIPKGYFDGIQAPAGAGKGDNFFAMSKADDADIELEGGTRLEGKAGAGGDWPVINERLSSDVVQQESPYGCVAAVGEMLSEGRFKQSELFPEIETMPHLLAKKLGPEWLCDFVAEKESAFAELARRGKPWSAELKDPFTHRVKMGHMVVVDGMDEAGNVMIRDPQDATRYEMTREDFIESWTRRGIWR